MVLINVFVHFVRVLDQAKQSTVNLFVRLFSIFNAFPVMVEHSIRK